jgi:hypothetical protein
MKWILPLLFILGFAVSVLSFYALRFTIGGDLLTITATILFIYLFPFVGGFFLVFVIPLTVKLHDSSRRLFEHALELREVGTVVWARIPVSIVLNLAYFTVLFFVPFSILAETVPLGKLVQNVVPSYTFTDLMASSLVVFFFVFSGSGGPATVYLIRYLKDVRSDNEIGGRTITVLQALCYVSWIALVLFFGAHVGFEPDKARLFLYYFFVFVLPATFANLVAFSSVRFVYKSKYIS